METLDLAKVDEEQSDGLTRWTEGPVSFKIRYASPRQSTKFRRRMEQLKIMSRDGSGPDIIPGREPEFCAEFAKEYVLDWRGVTLNHEPIPFDVIRMGQLLSSHKDVFRLIQDGIKESEAFFVANGNGSMKS